MTGRTAHPRVGGENGRRSRTWRRRCGSSPRGRGKLSSAIARYRSVGLIPAWAGKTLQGSTAEELTAAHPRVGGENAFGNLYMPRVNGSSPRGRGKHTRARSSSRVAGLIPAWAGKTLRCSRGQGRPPAHPRVGGENNLDATHRRSAPGSSPRGRGKRPCRDVERGERGLIPAWAGKTTLTETTVWAGPAHPRVGGENEYGFALADKDAGSSPRGRGKQLNQPYDSRSGRLIPAWAGKTECKHGEPVSDRAHPRVGGENTHTMREMTNELGSSPRGRGKQCPPRHEIPRRGLIPAWAGKTQGHP